MEGGVGMEQQGRLSWRMYQHSVAENEILEDEINKKVYT